MSAPPEELMLDVHRFIGSYLISNKPYGKKNGAFPSKWLAHDSSSSSDGYMTMCNSSSVNRSYTTCDCCQANYNGNNSMLAGMPLFSFARGKKPFKNKMIYADCAVKSNDCNGLTTCLSSQPSGSQQCSGVNNCPNEAVQRGGETSGGYAPHTCGASCQNNSLFLSKLAVHKQGLPLILNHSSLLRKQNQKAIANYNDAEFNRNCKSGDNRATLSSSSSALHKLSQPVVLLTDKMMEESYVVLDAKCESESSRGSSSSPSDCMSVTSEDSSGISEIHLPRIIKPRKRRKKEQRSKMLGSSGALVTLKPYLPLCYKFVNDPYQLELLNDTEEEDDKFGPKEFRLGSNNWKKLILSNGTKFPYLSSKLCTCYHCRPSLHLSLISQLIHSSPFLTPPPSPSSSSSSTNISPASTPPPPSFTPASQVYVTHSSRDETATKGCKLNCTNTVTNQTTDIIIKYVENIDLSVDHGSTAKTTIGTECIIEPIGFDLNLTVSHPPQRPWVTLPWPDPPQRRPTCVFTVMCYNVLCDKYATRQMYGYCPSWALKWEYRRKGILDEIRHYSADIISLQEVETEQFFQFFLPQLKRDGYNGIFSPKSRAKTMSENERKYVDGCAIFFRSTKFSLIKEHLVEFNQLAMANAEGSDDMLNRVMTKDNIGLAALLEIKDSAWDNGTVESAQLRQPILVSTAHIHWDPEYCDVKLIQTMMLMQELRNIVEESSHSFRPGSLKPDSNAIPLLLCGDFNSLPESGVIEFLTSGRVSVDHPDFKDLGYKACLRKLSSSDTCTANEFTHSFRMARAYSEEVMPFTNYTFDFKGTIDYIFFSKQCMAPLGLMGALEPEWLREHKVIGCPHPHIPSDHFSLLVEFEMALPSLTNMSNGLVLRR